MLTEVSGMDSVAQPQGQERSAPQSARLLYWLAAVFAGGSAAATLLAAVLAWSLPDAVAGVAEYPMIVGYLAAYLGVSWLAPGIFVGIAQRSAWTGVGVSFLLVVAQSILLVLAFYAMGEQPEV
jgi:hypothetical protein